METFTIDRATVRSVLVIKLRAIGDVLLSTAVLRSLRAALPDTRIDFLTENPSRQVIETNPDIDNAVIFDAKSQSGLALIRDIRRRSYDLVIDLFGNPRSALVTLLSGARCRVGYGFNWRRFCYNIVVRGRGGEVHNVQFNLDALTALGIPVGDPSVSFHTDAASEEFAARFFSSGGLDDRPVIAMNPGGGWYTKRWPHESFAELGDMLGEAYRTPVVIIWGPGEEPDARVIQAAMRSHPLLIPKTTLRELGAILKRCAALVTNDSGPMHVAAAVGTPVVAVFGPTIPELQGPVGAGHVVVQNRKLVCLGCNLTRCPIGNPCMRELPASQVFEGFRQLVEKNRLFHKERPRV